MITILSYVATLGAGVILGYCLACFMAIAGRESDWERAYRQARREGFPEWKRRHLGKTSFRVTGIQEITGDSPHPRTQQPKQEAEHARIPSKRAPRPGHEVYSTKHYQVGTDNDGG